MPDGPDETPQPAMRRWRPSPAVIVVLVVLGLCVVALIAMRSGEDFVAAPGGSAATTDGSTTTVASGTPTTSTPATWQTQFLACVATRESDDEPDAVGPGGVAFGTYQITQQTWDNTAEHYGWTDLVGVNPAQASADQQQQVAMALLQWQGAEPWGGGCSA